MTPLPTAAPPRYPLLGHLPHFLRDKLGFLLRCAADDGDVVALHLGGPTFLLNHPADIRHVLSTNHLNYEKSPRIISPRGKRVFGQGLISASSAAHARKRALVQPAFHSGSFSDLAPVVVSTTERMLSCWHDGAILDVAEAMMRLVQRIAIRMLFGINDEHRTAQLAAALTIRRQYLEYLFRSLQPFPEYLPTRINRRYRRAVRFIDATILGLIGAARNAPAPGSSLLSVLVHLPPLDGVCMSDRQIRDEVLTLSIASYETLGESLGWTWYLLAQHPEVTARLLEELHTVLEGRPPVLADVARLSYTEMVWSESMRLYPPTWLFVRVATRRDTLPSGTTIPAGAKVYLCQYVTHRNPRYFPEPDAFQPQRFGTAARHRMPRYAYFPFGGGPRTCIALALARMQALLLLATIAQRYHLTLVPGQDLIPEPNMTLRPRHGLLMGLTQR